MTSNNVKKRRKVVHIVGLIRDTKNCHNGMFRPVQWREKKPRHWWEGSVEQIAADGQRSCRAHRLGLSGLQSLRRLPR